MVDALQRIVVITKLMWADMEVERKVSETKRILGGHFVFYAVLPSTNVYVTVTNAHSELEAEVALEEFGYDCGEEIVVHETLWNFPHGFKEIARIEYEE